MATRNGKSDEVPEVMTDRELEKAGQEVAVTIPQKFNKEQLVAIDSFDAAIALAVAEYGDVIDAADQPLLGDGFRVATEEDKRTTLASTPLLLLDWRFAPSEHGNGEFVIIHAVARDTNGGAIKWIITDGGTGIRDDLQKFTADSGRDGGMLVKGGLRVSDYETDGDTGIPLTKNEVREYMVARKPIGKGHTFYLNA
jgi:hypothetical protein